MKSLVLVKTIGFIAIESTIRLAFIRSYNFLLASSVKLRSQKSSGRGKFGYFVFDKSSVTTDIESNITHSMAIGCFDFQTFIS